MGASGAKWSVGVLFAGLVVLGSLASGLTAAGTTYSVTFSEVGLPTGTTWSVYFNGVTYSPNASSVTITGLSAASYYWYASTVSGTAGVQYVPTGTTSAYMSVPSQTRQVLVFQKQYQLSFTASPPGTGTISPGYTQWENAGSTIPLSAGHYTGWSFTSWKVPKSVGTVTNTKSAATLLTIAGTGTVTANFKSVATAATVAEIGLPSGQTWSVLFNGVTYSSSTSKISVGSYAAGSYSWSISPVSAGTGVEYVASPSYGNLPMPYLNQVEVVFAKQDMLTMAVTPSGGGSTSPTSGWVPDGAAVPLVAYASTGYKFTTWSSGSSSVTFGNTTHSSTTATLTGPATVTAKFATGTLCTKCTATFYAVGLPAGTTWSINIGGTTYYSSTGSLVLTGVTSAFSFSTPGYVTGGPGVTYTPSSAVPGYFNIPYQSSVTIPFVKEYLVGFAVNPPGTGYLAPGQPLWLAAGGTYALAGIPYDQYVFKSWSSSTKTLALASKTSADTTFTVGAPGTITATFASPARTITFVEGGLPAGTTWSIDFQGITYTSSGPFLNVTGVPAATYTSWSVTTPLATSNPGVEYAAWNTGGYGLAGYATSIEVEFYAQDLVTFQTGSTTGGSVSPSGSYWYANGTMLAIDAINGTSVNFHGWSSKGGPFTVGQVAWAATTVVIGGPGNLTATFR